MTLLDVHPYSVQTACLAALSCPLSVQAMPTASSARVVDSTAVSLRPVTVQSVQPAPLHATSTPTPVQTLDAAQLHTLGLTTVADALKQLTGVSVQDYGGLGGMKTVSVRNMGAAHTAVCYDGVPVSNCMAGQIDVSRFGSEQIARIRLHLGELSDLLAPAALTAYSGILQLSSYDVSPRPTTRGGCSYGAWQTLNLHLAADLPLRLAPDSTLRHALSLRASTRSTAGDYPYTLTNGTQQSRQRRDNGALHSAHAEAHWTQRRGEVWRWDTKLYYYRIHQQLPGSIIYYRSEHTEALREENTLLQSHLDAPLGARGRWTAALKYNHAWSLYTNPSAPTTGGNEREVYRQDEGYAQGALSYPVWRDLTIALAQDVQWATLRASLTDCPYPRRFTSHTALRLQWVGGRARLLLQTLCTALRERPQHHLPSGSAAASGTLTPVHRSEQCWAPSLSATLQPLSGVPLYGRLSLKRAFRLPNFNDLYYHQIGNRQLRSERADEYSMGVTYRHRRASCTADLYYHRVHDKIVAFPSTVTWRMANYGRADLYGGDFTADYRQPLGTRYALDLAAGYMLRYAVDRTTPGSSTYRRQLPYTPRHSGNGSATLTTPWLTVGYTVQWMGERYSNALNTAHYRLAPYADQSLTLTHRLRRPDVTLYATLQNVTGASYEVVQYYPMPERQWRLGVRWSL